MPASRPTPAEVKRIHDRIADYVPRDASLPPGAWERVAGFVRATVETSGPASPGTATCELLVVARYATWCLDNSLPLEPEVIFTPDRIDDYDRRVLSAVPSRKDDRARLRRVGVAVTRKAPWPRRADLVPRSSRLAPYSDQELALLATMADGQRTQGLRDLAWGILALGHGCGLRPAEIFVACPGDITDAGDHVLLAVPGAHARTVPAFPRYADRLRRISKGSASTERIASGPNRLDNVIKKLRPVGALELLPTRLRTTWMVDVLNQGISVSEFLRLSGMRTTHSLLTLSPFLNARDEAALFRAIGNWSES